MIELARLVNAATGRPSRIDFQALPVDDPKQRCPDISRAKALLDWEPKVPIRLGLARTVSYFREIMPLVASSAWRQAGRGEG